MSDIDELKKLNPEDRIKKIKDLEKKLKKELEMAEGQAEDEIKTEKEKARPRPSLEEKKLPIEEESLEQVLKTQENKIIGDEGLKTQYQLNVNKEPIGELYNRLIDLYNHVQSTGQPSYEDMQEARTIGYAMMQKQQDMHKGVYSTTEELAKQADTGKKLADMILNLYKG